MKLSFILLFLILHGKRAQEGVEVAVGLKSYFLADTFFALSAGVGCYVHD